VAFFLLRHRRKAAAGAGAGAKYHNHQNDGNMAGISTKAMEMQGGVGEPYSRKGLLGHQDAGDGGKELPAVPGSETWTNSPTVGDNTPVNHDGRAPAEMPEGTYHHELDASYNTHEMDGGYHGNEMRGW
jgi:hypothetical protein